MPNVIKNMVGEPCLSIC